jgi:hypothetical protein
MYKKNTMKINGKLFCFKTSLQIDVTLLIFDDFIPLLKLN